MTKEGNRFQRNHIPGHATMSHKFSSGETEASDSLNFDVGNFMILLKWKIIDSFSSP